MSTSSGRLIEVDDFEMFVETAGAGEPLLLLNGGFGCTAIIQDLIEAFAQYFRVIAFDARGHGQSSFGSGPITYAREAADATRLLDALGLESAHVFGHSDGGCAALHLLFDYPHRVRSATLSGTPYSRSAYDEASARFCREFPATLARGEADALGFRDRLMQIGMPLEKIQRLGQGLLRAWTATPNFTLDMLAQIDRPVLVVEAGADQFIELRHFEEMTRAIPGARALRLPQMTHDPKPHAGALAAAAADLAGAIGARHSLGVD